MKILFIYIFMLALLLNVKLSNAQILFKLGNNGRTYGRQIAIDKDSNLIIAGTFQGKLNFSLDGSYEKESNLGSKDIFVAKYTKSGNLLWVKSFGTTGIEYPTALATDEKGNVYLSGYFGSENQPGRFIDLDPDESEDKYYGRGGFDCFLSKFNSDGEYQWGFVLTNIDGNGSDIIWDFDVTNKGDIYLGGLFTGTIDFNPKGQRKRIANTTKNYGYFVAKYNNKGENQWVDLVGANVVKPMQEGFLSLDINSSGSVYVCGNFRDTAVFEPDVDTDFPMVSSGSSDMFIAIYNSLGKIQMRGGFGGTQEDIVLPAASRLGKNGNFYISGKFKGTADFYPSFGEKKLTNSGNSSEIFLASYTSSGVLSWVFNIKQSIGYSDLSSLAFDEDNNICIAGWFNGSANFSPNGQKILNSNGTNGAGDAFLAKYDYTGKLMWANHFGGDINGPDKNGNPQITVASAVAVDFDNNAIISGKFYGKNIDFDPSDSTAYLSVEKTNDLFVAKYDYDGNLWHEYTAARPFVRVISPNGGEIWNVDSTRVITWYSRNIEKVKVELSIDNGENWIAIADSVSASSSSFTWQVENIISEQCKVRISDIDDNKYFDQSNGNFIITDEIKPIKVIFSYGTPGSSSGKSIINDNDNSFIVASSFQGTINCDNGKGKTNLTAIGTSDMALVKYNELGDLLWAFNIGNIGLVCEPTAMGIDNSGNIYVAGYLGGSGENSMQFDPAGKVKTIKGFSSYDAFLAKYDRNGNYIWAFALGNSETGTNESINDISVEKNGDIFITGYFSGKVDFNPDKKSENIIQSLGNNKNLFFAKYSSNGVYRWAIPLNLNTHNPDLELKASIVSDLVGGCYLSGNFRDTANFDPASNNGKMLISKAETDVFVAHYKINSHLDWLISIEGDGRDLTKSGNLRLSQDGNLYLTGNFIGNADFHPGLIKQVLTSDSTEDMFLSSYRTNGDLRWAFNIKSDFCKPNKIDFDSAGNIVVAGYFYGGAKFDSENDSLLFESNSKINASDIFIAKYSNEGKFIQETNFGIDSAMSEQFSMPNDINVDSKNNLLITGQFFGEKFDFNPNYEHYFLSSQGGSDAFVAKYFAEGKLWVQAVDSAKLYLLTPNGNEIWQVGSIHTIKWTSKFIDTLNISYSTNNGLDWIMVSNDISAQSGSFTWLIPNTPSDSCIVSLQDPNHKTRIDISNKKFTITNRTITILYPNGGEKLKAHTQNSILWESTIIKNLDIYYSIDGGKKWNPIAVNLPSEKDTIHWITPDISSNQCLIKIIDNSNNEIFDLSDNYFAIEKVKNPEIKLLKPNGKEEWLISNSYLIKWQSKDIDNVKIELSVDMGNSWQNIVDSYPNIDNDYLWEISDTKFISDSCLLKVSDKANPDIYDNSDSVFSIRLGSNVADNKINNVQLEIYPEPFKDYLNIKYNLPKRKYVNLRIYNMLGNSILLATSEYQDKGEKTYKLNSSKLQSGFYYLILQIDELIIMKKLIHI